MPLSRGPMPEQDQDQVEKLKAHFGRRVVDQARIVIDLWQRLPEFNWRSDWFGRMVDALEKLEKFSQRFEQKEFIDLVHQIRKPIEDTGPDKSPTSEVITLISDLIARMANLSMRRGDDGAASVTNLVKKPIYILLDDQPGADSLAEHLGNFGFNAQSLDGLEAFQKAMAYRFPAAMIVEVDYEQTLGGVNLVEKIQKGLDPMIDTVFYSKDSQTMETRIRCLRAGGVSFCEGKLDITKLVELFEQLSDVVFPEPFRVMIVEDSRSQLVRAERALNNAGMVTCGIADPLKVFAELESFRPELILMDMYMPQCNGIELAAIIRQESKFDSIPITYLSSEGDIDKQLVAMAKGGDEFLTKPVKPKYLVAAVKNRANRSRILKSRMVRDSLTGLLDHTTVLQQLAVEQTRAEAMDNHLCFAMLDIDHFKNINDTYGHGVGDRVIKSLALFLRQRLRKSDTIGRYGGEEFAVILPDTLPKNAKKIFKEILSKFREINHVAGDEAVHVTFSCGIAEATQVGDGKITKCADEALYEAKAAGRNQVTVYHGDGE